MGELGGPGLHVGDGQLMLVNPQSHVLHGQAMAITGKSLAEISETAQKGEIM